VRVRLVLATMLQRCSKIRSVSNCGSCAVRRTHSRRLAWTCFLLNNSLAEAELGAGTVSESARRPSVQAKCFETTRHSTASTDSWSFFSLAPASAPVGSKQTMSAIIGRAICSLLAIKILLADVGARQDLALTRRKHLAQ